MKTKDTFLQQSFGSQAKIQPWCNRKFSVPLCPSSLTLILTKSLKKSTAETSLWSFITFRKIQRKLIRSSTKPVQAPLLSMTQLPKCWTFIFHLVVLVRVVTDDSTELLDLKLSAIQKVSVRPKPLIRSHWTWDSLHTQRKAKNLSQPWWHLEASLMASFLEESFWSFC